MFRCKIVQIEFWNSRHRNCHRFFNQRISVTGNTKLGSSRSKLVDQGSGSIYLSRPQESRWLRRFVERTKVDKPERGRESRIRSHRTRVSESFDPESQQVSDSSESRSAPVFSRFLSSFRSRARTLSDCSATRCYVLHSRYIATTMHERFLRTCTCTRGRKRYFRNGIFRNGIHIYPMQR